MNLIKFLFALIISADILSTSLFSQNNSPNGYNKFFYENGSLSSEGLMRNGKPDGYWISYHKNGKLKIEGNRRNFELDSIWKFYDDRGKVTRTVNYKLGKKHGALTNYDTSGNRTSEEMFVHDVKEGLSRTFYPSGKVRTTMYYVKGKPEYNAYEYSEDSLITGISYYRGGILQGYEKINQKDDQNRKQGIWKEFYKNMEVKKSMKYNDDSLDGYVKDFDAKGNLLTTKKFDNGKRVMKAPEIANVEVYREVFSDGTLKYEGVFVDSLAIGTHYRYRRSWQCDSSLFRKDSSNLYENRFVCRYVPVPDSAIEYFDGIVIARGAVDSLRNRRGLWTEYHHTGAFRGKGWYKDGYRTGEWDFFYPSGKLEQKGKYDKKGRMQGDWKWYHENGQIQRQEHYVNGKREGEMKDFDEEGKVVLQGQYVDNKKEGFWKYETADYLEYGNYVNDEPDSLWKSFYMPSKTRFFEGNFVAGVPVGMHVGFHPNGARKYSGVYVSGMRDGDWKFYDENDYNYLTITYKNDIELKWQGERIYPTYEQSLRTYNVKVGEGKTKTIRK
jgi:antitoxin component YwqK of YwqJK toxin-antitoxin module